MWKKPPPPPVTNIHASCVAIGTRGVLLLGASGMGKSDLALRLIDRGARLVADDRCDIMTESLRLLCRPPNTLAGLIEVRGIGLRTLPYVAPVQLVLAVRLTERYERMPGAAATEIVAGIALPLVILSAFEQSAPIKVELALDQLMEQPKSPGDTAR